MDSNALFSSNTVEEIRAVEHKTRLVYENTIQTVGNFYIFCQFIGVSRLCMML